MNNTRNSPGATGEGVESQWDAAHNERLSRMRGAFRSGTNADFMMSAATRLRHGGITVTPGAHRWRPDMTPEEMAEYILAHVPDLIDIGFWAWYEILRQDEVAQGEA